MWSVGCIIGELLGRKPLFKGRDHLTQLTAITQVLGTPPKDLIIRIASLYAWDYFAASIQYPKTPFSELYPTANSGSIDLIEKLLQFDPDVRPSAEECISHPYLKFVRSPDDEPVSSEYFDFSFEKLSSQELEMALREEVKSFRREVRNEPYNGVSAGPRKLRHGGQHSSNSYGHTQSHNQHHGRSQLAKYA